MVVNGTTDVVVADTQEATLLFMCNMARVAYKKFLTRHLLQAAKTVIPWHWKTSSPPSIKELLAEITHIQCMEELIAQTPEDTNKCNKTIPLVGVQSSHTFNILSMCMYLRVFFMFFLIHGGTLLNHN